MRPQPSNIESTKNEKPADSWLTRAQSAWQISTTYYETNLQNRQVRNQCLFDSKHPPGSKYHTEPYKYRSRLFRPKIRAAARKLEAAANQAFFSTIDAIDVKPMDDTLANEVIAAKLTDGTLKHHLTNTMFWYQNCVAAVQDAFKTGVCISYNYWLKQVVKHDIEQIQFDTGGNAIVDKKGNFITKTVTKEEIIEDRPCVELMPLNRVRYHPAAHWIDPMNTSPFVCLIRPMYIYDILGKMRDGEWAEYGQSEIKSAKLSQDNDAVEQRRREGRQDPLDLETPGIGHYDMSICLQWFMIDDNGQRVTFWTLGTKYRLSEPVPVKNEFPHGKTPVTMGYLFLEAHKNMPTSGVQLAEQQQKETNDLANARLDNLKFVLNKRYLVRRGANVDIKSLVTNAPASVTLMENIDTDVKPLEWNDINPAAFAEQDRINVDMDELLGSFSQSSVQSNRQLNETVGGMAMLQGSAGQMTDYDLRTFVETWMEPTLRQIVSLLQHYESNEELLNTVGRSQQLEGPIKDEMLDGRVQLTVNVGVGAGNPVFKAQQFIMAIKQLAEILVMLKQAQINGVQGQEIATELFGYIGYKDGSRFFKLDDEGGMDPQIQELQAQLQELTSKLESKQIETEGRLSIERLKEAAEAGRARKQREHEDELNKRDNHTKLRIALLNAKRDKDKQAIEREKIRVGERMNNENNQTTRDTAKLSSEKAKAKPAGESA